MYHPAQSPLVTRSWTDLLGQDGSVVTFSLQINLDLTAFSPRRKASETATKLSVGQDLTQTFQDDITKGLGRYGPSDGSVHYLGCEAAVSQDGGAGTASQIEEEEIRPVFVLRVVAANAALRVRRVDEALGVAQHKTFTHTTQKGKKLN